MATYVEDDWLCIEDASMFLMFLVNVYINIQYCVNNFYFWELTVAMLRPSLAILEKHIICLILVVTEDKKHYSSAQWAGHLALIHPSIQTFLVKHMVTVAQLSNLMASLHAIQADRTFHIHIFIMHYTISFKKVTILYHRNPLFDQHH
ncbi:hypothetical protein CFP56_022435 [Quercus suber]|uniref:Uncharacterized protein n=1 Tax=Quercus suber TaxID=58331 RepID=A0AAW0KC85_QUESU